MSASGLELSERRIGRRSGDGAGAESQWGLAVDRHGDVPCLAPSVNGASAPQRKAIRYMQHLRQVDAGTQYLIVTQRLNFGGLDQQCSGYISCLPCVAGKKY